MNDGEPPARTQAEANPSRQSAADEEGSQATAKARPASQQERPARADNLSDDASSTPAKDAQGSKKAVLAQVLRQIVRQNSSARPEALAFLQGQINDEAMGQLPALMTSSRFIADVLMEQDLGAFMAEDLKPSAVMRELGFSPDMITQALALGIDNEGPVERGVVLAALGAEPAKLKTSIDRIKGVLTREGVTGYIQQALAIAKTSGKQPAILESLVARDLEDASSDLAEFRNDTSLEVQAVMAQALAASGSWAPLQMAHSGAPKLDAPAIASQTSLLAAPLAPPAEFVAVSDLNIHEPSAVTNDFDGELSTPADPLTFGDNTELGLVDASLNSRNGKIQEFAARLQAEFGDGVRILDVGMGSWDGPISPDFAGSLPRSADDSGRAFPEIQAPDAEGAFAPGEGILSQGAPGREAVVPQLSSKSFASADSLADLKTPLRPGDFEAADITTPANQLAAKANDAAPAKFSEPPVEAAPRVEGQDSTVALANPLMFELQAPEVAETAEPERGERVEVNSRHAAETVRKIQDAVRRTTVSGIGAMRLDLSSAETGNVEIAVRVDSEQQVDVRVMAASGELRDLIARELPQLKASLGEQNLNLRDLDVRSWTAGSGQQSSPGDFSRGGNQDDWREAASKISSGISGGRNAATASIDALKGQMGRQALRAFKILDMTERSGGAGSFAAGRIKVLV